VTLFDSDFDDLIAFHLRGLATRLGLAPQVADVDLERVRRRAEVVAPDAVERATGTRPALPDSLADLFERREHYDVLPADMDAVGRYVKGAVTAH